jgi:uncharacterized protein YdaU (DUF1376 family)
MHYYQFNIGDYIKNTLHLSIEEDLAYRRLLDFYYDSEQPIPNDIPWVSRRLRMSSDVIESVLNEFFVLTENGYTNHRADLEIASYHEYMAKQKANGMKGGRPKKTQTKPTANPDETQNNPKQEPLTINQEPRNNIKEGKPSLSGTTFPPCPHTELLKLWAKHLPHLVQPRSWEGNRQANMRQRWIQAGKPSAYSPDGYKTTEDGLKWWDSFFGYIANDTSLAKGFEAKGRTWLPDLEWVVNATNFQKIIDGKYTK